LGRSRKYHPDRAGRQYENLFIVIRQAYEALSDPVKRYAYDRCVE
jgi:DnaJ-class molecular chaperone